MDFEEAIKVSILFPGTGLAEGYKNLPEELKSKKDQDPMNNKAVKKSPPADLADLGRKFVDFMQKKQEGSEKASAEEAAAKEKEPGAEKGV